MASSIAYTHHQQLSPGSNFSDAFWDGKNKGVEIISSRLRKSKDTCEEIKKLYEARANIEQDYGERLLKLAQNSRIGEFEEDTFAETLLRIPSTLEATARAHIDLAQQLKDHLEAPLDSFLKDQRDARKMQQQHIENSRQLKNLHEADVARAKDYYSIECGKLSSLEKTYASLATDGLKNDLIKIEKEIEEQRRMVTVADQVYRRSVDNYNTVIEKWVNDWTSSADKFQEMELKRMSYLRSTLWSFSNMMTSTFSIDEECCDRIRTALEITDVQKDIASFVSRYGTGTRIPVPLSYEVFHNSTQIKSLIPEVAPSTPITNVVNVSTIDYTDHQQTLSPPTKKASLESLPETNIRGASESNITVKSIPVTILTNPDEELKSVDRQLQRLEVVQNTTPQSEDENHFLMQTSPQHYTFDEKRGSENKIEYTAHQPLSGVTNTTDQSYGPVSTAIKEVEQILNIRGFSTADEISPTPISRTHDDVIPVTKNVISNRMSYGSNTQTIPPIMMARSINSEKIGTPTHHPFAAHLDDFSTGIYDTLDLQDDQQSSQYDSNNHKEVYSPPLVKLAPLSSSDTPIIATLEPFSNQSHISTESNSNKYKPTPNPVYSSNNLNMSSTGNTEKENILPETVPNQQRPTFSARTSSLLSTPKQDFYDNSKSPLNLHITDNTDDNDDENAEDRAYHDRMPRPPPKDEKWVISSIRRPQQLPVRALNAKMFDGTASISRHSTTGGGTFSNVHDDYVQHQPELQYVEEEQGESKHHPKVHRPVIPLTIDIPNSVKPSPELPQTIAQQAIAEGRRLSQMSPTQQKMDLNNTVAYNQQQSLDRNAIRGYIVQNGLEDGGIRPAPWQEETHTDDRVVIKNVNFRGTPQPMNNTVTAATTAYYINGHLSPSAPRGASFKISSQEHQQQQSDEENKRRLAKNNTKQHSETSLKSKDKDNKGGRFSLGFFTGNKKEKKKGKEAAAIIAAANAPSNNQAPSDQQQFLAQQNYMTQQQHQQQQKQQQQQQHQYQQQQHQYQQQHQHQLQQQQHLQERPISQLAKQPQEISQTEPKSFHSNNHNNQTVVPSQSTAPTPAFDGSRYIGYAKAQWQFEATIDGEMSFHADELIGILGKQSDGWWDAERIDPAFAGQRGLVPGNYMIETIHHP